MILLDTTFLIDTLKGKEYSRKKMNELNDLLFTTRINIFEVLVGLFSIKKSESIIREHFNSASNLFSQLNILELDEKSMIKSAEIAGNLNKLGRPIGSTDCLIAGIALSNGIKTIITRNIKHFENIEELNIETY